MSAAEPPPIEALVRTEKLAAVGRLAAQVAHQLNTPLAAALLSARALEGAVSGPEAGEDLALVLQELRRCQRIVRRFQNFARAPNDRRDRVNFCHLVHRVEKVLERSLAAADVTLRVRVARGRYLVRGDASELEHALFAVLENAIDASPRGGAIDLALSLDYDAGRLEAWIQDEGPGLDPAAADRLFEPFFTTKAPGVGTGLGLSIGRELVEAHGGAIEPVPGPGGATFRIRLPLAPALLTTYRRDPAALEIRAVPFGALRGRARGELETGCEARGLAAPTEGRRR